MSEIIQNSEATPASNSAAILTGAALLGGAALFASPKAARAQTKSTIPYNEAIFGTATGDVKILNYALALEALETDLYVQALQRLTTGGTNALGQTITGLNQSESSAAVQYLRQFGKVELSHRNFLNGALGSASILAAGNALDGAKFDFGFASNSTTVASVVNVVRDAEETGVQAYIGVIPQFTTATYLQTAAAIEGTEARHSAVITAIYNGLTGQSLPVAPTATTVDASKGREITTTQPQTVINKVRPFIVLRGEAGNPAN